MKSFKAFGTHETRGAITCKEDGMLGEIEDTEPVVWKKKKISSINLFSMRNQEILHWFDSAQFYTSPQFQRACPPEYSTHTLASVLKGNNSPNVLVQVFCFLLVKLALQHQCSAATKLGSFGVKTMN